MELLNTGLETLLNTEVLPRSEIKKRRAALKTAKRSIEMEGGTVSEEAQELSSKWASGLLSGDEVIAALKAKYQ